MEIKKTASKQFFTIEFNPAIYRPRDSVKITFGSYKVALTNLPQGTTYKQWLAKVGLVYFINNNWILLVADTNDRINRAFSGKNNTPADSLKNYSIYLTVPLSRKYTISTTALYFELNNKAGSPLLSGGKVGITLTTSIKGIEVKKLGLKP